MKDATHDLIAKTIRKAAAKAAAKRKPEPALCERIYAMSIDDLTRVVDDYRTREAREELAAQAKVDVGDIALVIQWAGLLRTIRRKGHKWEDAEAEASSIWRRLPQALKGNL